MKSLFLMRHVKRGDAVARPPAFWVESTAPLNVDGKRDRASSKMTGDFTLAPDASDLTDDEIAGQIALLASELKAKKNPQILVAIHGYNNNVDDAMRWMESLYAEVQAEQVSRQGGLDDLICVGYHWPSEKLGEPGRPITALWTSAPASMRWLGTIAFLLALVGLYGFVALLGLWVPQGISLRLGVFLGVGLALVGLGGLALAGRWLRPLLLCLTVLLLGFGALCYFLWPRGFWMGGLPFGVLAGVLFALPLSLAILRFSSYFRDFYRATQYGVPDMVDFFQKLDIALAGSKEAAPWPLEKRISVSFLGHSMGAYVVTSLVRILSDVFGSHYDPASDTSDPSIGKTLKLNRLVLVSPDIPVEAVRTGRANFLAPSLRRFREVVLFTNGADEVLRVISTIANYFSFPAQKPANGERLGNLTVGGAYGIHNREGAQSEQATLTQLTINDRYLRDVQKLEGGAAKTEQLEERFTLVDCTSFKEDGRAWLGPDWPDDRPDHKLTAWRHFKLLLAYGLGKVDGHSGYFQPHRVRRLMIRAAALGWDELSRREETEHSGGFVGFCIAHRLKIRLAAARFRGR
jgi:hypothetical protein